MAARQAPTVAGSSPMRRVEERPPPGPHGESSAASGLGQPGLETGWVRA
jgi:hypothetical protein